MVMRNPDDPDIAPGDIIVWPAPDPTFAHYGRAIQLTSDMTMCDVGGHQQCEGHTLDEADPEPCMCDCHRQAWLHERPHVSLHPKDLP